MNATPDIVVTAWSARFGAAFRRMELIEGGFVNDPVDRGGATKYGISLRFLVSEGRLDLDEDGIADFDLDMDGDIDVADIKALTPGDARYLYHRCFWTRLDCDMRPAPLGEAMFDQGVNGGLVAARKLLQQAINRVSTAGLVVDGAIGPLSLVALDRVLYRSNTGMPGLIAAYRACAADRYRGIVARAPSQARFLNGWLRRAAELGTL
jgi:lysozyme family protein